MLAPSNAAVANVALRLVRDKDQFGRENVVVWGDNCSSSVRFLNPKFRYKEYRHFIKDYSGLEDEKEQQEKLQKLAAWLAPERSELSLEDVEALCTDESGHKSIAAARVVLCTLNTAGSMALRKAVNACKHKFELCVLDEASQCTEAEFYIATTFPGVKRVVVVGDPRQLGPTVVDKNCDALGYGESFLGHVLRYHPSKVHLLDTQYRMDPSRALDFVNQTFYQGRLMSDDMVKNREPIVKHPFQFISTSEEGSGTEENEHFSYKNEYEVGGKSRNSMHFIVFVIAEWDLNALLNVLLLVVQSSRRFFARTRTSKLSWRAQRTRVLSSLRHTKPKRRGFAKY